MALQPWPARRSEMACAEGAWRAAKWRELTAPPLVPGLVAHQPGEREAC